MRNKKGKQTRIMKIASEKDLKKKRLKKKMEEGKERVQRNKCKKKRNTEVQKAQSIRKKPREKRKTESNCKERGTIKYILRENERERLETKKGGEEKRNEEM